MRKLFRRDMLRPTIYKTVSRSLTALALLLLWDRFLDGRGAPPVLWDGCLTAAAVFFTMAWLSYLKLDGMRVHHLLEDRKKQPSRHKSKDLVDFVDEHIVSFDELSEEERTVCVLASNLLSGMIYLLPALAALLFRAI